MISGPGRALFGTGPKKNIITKYKPPAVFSNQ